MERVLTELVLGLRSRRHEVSVIARTCELPASAGVCFHRVRGPRRPFVIAYPWFVLAGSLAVARWRRGVVQATGAIVLNRVDVVAVHYCHQVGPANPSRARWLFRAQMGAVRLMKRLAERACFRLNAPRAFVCVSDAVAEEVRTHYPAVRERVQTIHNGVDTAAFAPGERRDGASALRAQLGIAEGRLIAAFVGSEWERKGLRAAIEALALAPEWDLVVAGDGDRPRYEQLADSLSLTGAVHWLGLRPDVQVVYELADAFVLPSAYETFSLVAFEAAASGLPVLATPVGGIRELVRDSENGFLITRDPALLAERLRALGHDARRRSRMAQAARESALPFTWKRMVERHEQLYEQLAASA
jgi:glycosyltransferase involved in cell wall biosynthesis